MLSAADVLGANTDVGDDCPANANLMRDCEAAPSADDRAG